jgi:uncharacterized protein with FMN-binding domain
VWQSVLPGGSPPSGQSKTQKRKEKESMKKRLLSLVLCLVMVFSLFPSFAVPASAVSGSDYAADGEWPGASQSGATLRYGDNTGSALSKKVNFSVTVSVSDHKITNVSISVANRNNSTNTNQRRWDSAADSIASAYVAKLKDPASSYYIIGKDATLAAVNAAQSATDSRYTTLVRIPTTSPYQLTELQKGYFEYDIKQALIAAIQSADTYQLKPDEEYIYTPVAMPSGGWKTDSDYGTEQLYALVNGEYVPVTIHQNDIYEKLAKTSWTPQEAHDYIANNNRDLFYKNGSTFEKVYATQDGWFENAGTVSVAGWTYKWWYSQGFESNYYYNSAADGAAPFWHRVYYAVHGRSLSGWAYFFTFYIYTNSMYGNAVKTTTGATGSLSGYDSTYTNAINNGTITLITDDEGAAHISDGDTFETPYTGGKLYTYHSSNDYTAMWTSNDGGETSLTELAWALPASNGASTYQLHSYSGDLYVVKPGVTKITYGDGTILTQQSNIAGEVLYNGPLYTRSIGTRGSLEGFKSLSERNDDGSYDLTIDSWATGPIQDYNNIPGSEGTPGETTESVIVTKTQIPLDIVLVVDQSGSMATADMGSTESYNPAGGGKTSGWSEAEITDGTEYYCYVNGGYQRVYAETGNVYEKASATRASDMFGYGHDGITLLVNGAPVHFNVPTDYYILDNGTMRRIYMATAGLDLYYGLYPYVYTDNATEADLARSEWKDNFYWFVLVSPWGVHKFHNNNDTWNDLYQRDAFSWIDTDGNLLGSSDAAGNSAKLDYSWIHSSSRISGDKLYTVSDTAPARLYYMNGNQKVYISNTRNFGDETFTITGTADNKLYVKHTETTRVAALQAAVRKFASDLAQNAAENNMEHKLAIVGFAGNKVPAYASGKTAFDGQSTKLEYTDTGLFLNGTFVNYQNYKTPQYVPSGDTSTDTLYQNVTYYVENNGSFRPIRYNLSSHRWFYADASNEYYTSAYGSKSDTFYRANLQSLTPEQYQSALVSVTANDATSNHVNDYIDTAIDNFGYYGGTYTSYGLAMANNILAQSEIRHDGKKVTTTTTYTYVDGEQQGEPAVETDEETGLDGKRIIVVFTDGEPGGYGYETAIANEALAGGVKAKMADGYDATVYTVGLYPGSVSRQVENFMHQLSSEYTAQLTVAPAGSDYANQTTLDPDNTYYFEKDGKFYSAQAVRNGSSSLGWWRHNADGSYSPLTVKGKNGGGSDILYTSPNGGSSVYGENANENTTYYNNGRPVRYEYRWYDSDGLVVEPYLNNGSMGNLPDGANTSNRYQFYSITGQNVNTDGEQYYYKVQNSQQLYDAFASIITSIDTQTQSTETTGTPPTPATTESVSYGAQNAMIRDVISSAFDLDPNATVEVQLVPAQGFATVTEDGTDYNKATPTATGTVETLFTATASETTKSGMPAGTDETITYTHNGRNIDITGFDFSKYYITDEHEGKLLRVIVRGLQPNGTGDLYSNTQKSAIYKRDAQTGAVGDELFNYNDPHVNVQDYTITWLSEGSELEKDEHVPHGSTPSYDGETPVKAATADYTYEFAGWAAEGSDTVLAQLPIVTSDATYHAVFTQKEILKYTVHWMNGSNEVETDPNVATGEYPFFDGDTPEAPSGKYFAGWTWDQNAVSTLDETKMYHSDKTVEELNPDAQRNVYLYAVFVSKTVESKTFIVEYSTKTMISANGQEVTSFDRASGLGGDLILEDGKLYYMPVAAERNENGNVCDMTGFSQINTVYYYTTDATKAYKVDIIPGVNMYFDDSITSIEAGQVTSDGVTTMQYEAAMNETDVNTDVEQIEGGSQLTFTFTGTGIEVYAHTSTNSGKVGAYLYKDGQMVQSKIMNNNSKDIDLYNVPTIRFDVDYGTYTLVIIPNKSADYRLDGVRVFNPGTEKTAQYLNVREQLLDQYKENQTIFGALFLVGNTREASVATYTKYGPKNEVYLDAGESVTFQVKGWTGGTYRIGLGAVSGDTINAAVSNGDNTEQPIAHTVRGKTHVFYQVIPAANGSVVITNNNETKGEILSITDLEIVGGEAAAIVEPELITDDAPGAKLAVTRSLMTYARSFDADAAQPLPADPEPTPSAEPTPTPSADPEPSPSAEPSPTPSAEPSDPTPTPTIGNWISQLFSNFVNSLFGSIARLFGGH